MERGGFICKYDIEKGFGFIAPDGGTTREDNIHFHASTMDARMPKPPPLGLRVVLVCGPIGPRGGSATSVRAVRVQGIVENYDPRGFGSVVPEGAARGSRSHDFDRKELRNGEAEGLQKGSRVSFLLGKNLQGPNLPDVALDIMLEAADRAAAAAANRFPMAGQDRLQAATSQGRPRANSAAGARTACSGAGVPIGAACERVGFILKYDLEKGFGFIAPDGATTREDNIYFHASTMEARMPKPPPLGLRVVLLCGPIGPRGGSATSVRAVRVQGIVENYDPRGFGFVVLEGAARGSRSHDFDRKDLRNGEAEGLQKGSRVSFLLGKNLQGPNLPDVALDIMLEPADRAAAAAANRFPMAGHDRLQAATSQGRQLAPAQGLPPPEPQPVAHVARRTLRVVAIIVDGYCFKLETRGQASSVAKLIAFVIRELAREAGVPEDSILVPHDAKAFFHPDENDARRKGIIGTQQCQDTNDYLSELEADGWQIERTGFKKENGNWKASIEDLAFLTQCDKFTKRGAFNPVGARAERVTATDVFIVTGDADHIVTLKSGEPDTALRWCVLLSKNYHLEQWGLGTQRLLRFP